MRSKWGIKILKISSIYFLNRNRYVRIFWALYSCGPIVYSQGNGWHHSSCKAPHESVRIFHLILYSKRILYVAQWHYLRVNQQNQFDCSCSSSSSSSSSVSSFSHCIILLFAECTLSIGSFVSCCSACSFTTWVVQYLVHSFRKAQWW